MDKTAPTTSVEGIRENSRDSYIKAWDSSRSILTSMLIAAEFEGKMPTEE